MKKREKRKKGNLKIAALFIAVILFLIFISFILKLIVLFKDSKFDGAHRFTVAVVKNNKTQVISVSPGNKTISLLTIDGKVENINNFLKIPIDAFIYSDNLYIERSNVSSSFFKEMLNLNANYSGATVIDLFRLSYFARSLPLTSVYEKKVSKGDDELKIDLLVNSFFTDQEILSEKKRIQIINGTDVLGAGSKLAKVINNMGGDVILISTSDKEENKSKIIYFGDKTYTIRRIASFLNFPTEEGESRSIADVIIVIGEDRISEFKY